eukprot:scaffold316032_cov53-Attheya_sp.AAC.1
MVVAMKKWQLMLLLLTAPVNAQTETNDFVCDFCADGSALDPAFSGVEIEVDGSSTTCADYSNEVALFQDFCSQVDYDMTGSFCGCPDPVPCSFCADGSDFDAAFADVVADTDVDTGEDITCADFAVSVTASIFQNNIDCPLSQIQAFISCGCPTAPEGTGSCSFCTDGSGLKDEFADTELIDQDTGDTVTCGEVALVFPFLEEEFFCLSLRSEYSTQCGCSSEPEPGCSFCADGSDPAVGFEDVIAFVEDNGENTTCADLAFGLPFLPVDDNIAEICTGVQLATFTSCGCPAPPEGPGSCSFCADGSDPAEGFEDVVVVDEADGEAATTCADLALGLPFLPIDDTTPVICTGVQLATFASCGCPVPPEGSGSCSLCADGSDPAEGFEDVIAFVEDNGDETTCADLALGLPFLPANDTTPEICTSIQFQTFTSCGCPALPTGACTLCADGSAVPDESLELLPDATCGELSISAAPSGPEECTAFQVTAGIYCGCDVNAISTVENICRLCGGTKLLPEISRQIQFEGEAEPCGFVEFSANQNETCSSFQETYGPQCCSSVVSTTTSPSKMPSKAPTGTTGSTTPAPSTSNETIITDTTGSTTSAPSPSSGAILVKVGLPIFVVMVAAFFTL